MRSDQWSNTVTIGGRPLGIWDTLSGGGVTAEETKHRPGGMQPEVSLGGPESVEELGVSKLLTRAEYDFLSGLIRRRRIGREQAVVNRQPLDIDGNPWGQPLTYRGVLQSVTLGDTDSNSSDAQMCELTISVGGGVG